jgi:hypothetical protein
MLFRLFLDQGKSKNFQVFVRFSIPLVTGDDRLTPVHVARMSHGCRLLLSEQHPSRIAPTPLPSDGRGRSTAPPFPRRHRRTLKASTGASGPPGDPSQPRRPKVHRRRSAQDVADLAQQPLGPAGHPLADASGLFTYMKNYQVAGKSQKVRSCQVDASNRDRGRRSRAGSWSTQRLPCGRRSRWRRR